VDQELEARPLNRSDGGSTIKNCQAKRKAPVIGQKIDQSKMQKKGSTPFSNGIDGSRVGTRRTNNREARVEYKEKSLNSSRDQQRITERTVGGIAGEFREGLTY